MKKIILAWGFIVFFCSGVLAFSTATVAGPIGLIEVPTAFTLEEKQFYFGTSYSQIVFFDPGNPNTPKKELWQSKFNLTVFRDLEMGVIGESGREGVFLNLKYYLINPVVSGPLALAIGLENLTSYNRADVYMVASKRFNQYLAAHFGFKSEFPPGKIFVSAMAGLELMFTPQFSIVADYRGGDNLSRLNLGLKFLAFDVVALNLSGIDIFGQSRGYSIGAGLINYF